MPQRITWSPSSFDPTGFSCKISCTSSRFSSLCVHMCMFACNLLSRSCLLIFCARAEGALLALWDTAMANIHAFLTVQAQDFIIFTPSVVVTPVVGGPIPGRTAMFTPPDLFIHGKGIPLIHAILALENTAGTMFNDSTCFQPITAFCGRSFGHVESVGTHFISNFRKGSRVLSLQSL